jgi:hypothetical protein
VFLGGQGNRKTSIRDLLQLQIAAELSRFLTTDHTDTIWIKPKNNGLKSHPFPIYSESVVKNDFVHELTVSGGANAAR